MFLIAWLQILQSNCKQQSKKYLSARSMWLGRVVTDLANTDQKHCLTIDCSNVNKSGPRQYGTLADNPDGFAILINHMTTNLTMFL